MQLDITGRHVEITPALREFAEEKLRKLERLLDPPLEIHVVLGIEKHRHTAEIQVKSKSGVFSGTQETGDLYVSIGEVVDKLERQARRHKEKLRTRRVKKGPRRPEAAAVIEAQAAPPSATPAGAPAPAAASSRFVRGRGYRVKPLSPEDAVAELETTNEDLLVFRDADTDRVNVVYRRKDGNFALVEPEF